MSSTCMHLQLMSGLLFFQGRPVEEASINEQLNQQLSSYIMHVLHVIY